MMTLNNRICLYNQLIKRFFSKIINKEIDILQNSLTLTDQKENRKVLKDWSLFKSTPEAFDQSCTNVFLFPGQGSQYVGMCRNFVELPQVKRLFESASTYLNYDVLKICLEGPCDKLNTIFYSHPAIYVASIAALEKIKHEQPELIENCIATAGYDLGEITSLVFAGVLTFEAGLHFIRVRAEQIEKACQNQKGGLLMVKLFPKSQLGKAMLAARKYCNEKLNIENPVCQLSTNLFTECKIIGGHIEALEFIETFSKEFKLKSTKILNASGAFHTPLMNTAVKPCRKALNEIGEINEQKIIVFSNATGNVYTSKSEIKRLLSEQISRPVFWEQIIMRMYMRPRTSEHPNTIEIGPGSKLKQTIFNVNAIAVKKYRNIPV